MVATDRAAALADGSAEQAVAILTLIAEAEATIHQVPMEEVHFHEIADWDSLLDVTAAGSIAAALRRRALDASPPCRAAAAWSRHGMACCRCRHPRRLALLTGFAWRDDGIGGERVTPTGAAILRHLVGPDGSGFGDRFLPCGKARLDRYGRRNKDLPGIPNVLRALVFEAEPAPAATGTAS